MPDAVAMRTYREHQAFYDKLQIDVASDAGKADRRSRHRAGAGGGAAGGSRRSSSKFNRRR